MILLVNSIAHFLVDALCISTLFSTGVRGELLTLAVVLYNTLAFSTQCIVGLIIDRIGRERLLNAASMLVVVLGFVLPFPYLLRVCIVGMGNSVFHVAAGTMTLKRSNGKAGDLGVFVAPGAFGVTLGTCFPHFGIWLSLGLALCTVIVLLPDPLSLKTQKRRSDEMMVPGAYPVLSIVLLTCAVAVRAVGGSAVSFPWKIGTGMAVLMTAFVFAGKSLGGFICDRLGPNRTALISVPIAAVCIAFFSAYAVPSLLGQFLLNMTMPVTLYLLYRALPDAPGFSFGIAASALWPGTIAGQMFRLTGPALWACVTISFLFGLLAIHLSVLQIDYLKRGNKP